MDRYAIAEESLSGHCCFGYTVVDKTIEYGNICECFNKHHAEMICNALNNKYMSPEDLDSYRQDITFDYKLKLAVDIKKQVDRLLNRLDSIGGNELNVLILTQPTISRIAKDPIENTSYYVTLTRELIIALPKLLNLEENF